jgi:hypothetical protein
MGRETGVSEIALGLLSTVSSVNFPIVSLEPCIKLSV